jgi:hypothetical protein
MPKFTGNSDRTQKKAVDTSCSLRSVGKYQTEILPSMLRV